MLLQFNKDAEITLINTESEFLFAQAGIPNPHTLLGKPLETVMNGLTLDTDFKRGKSNIGYAGTGRFCSIYRNSCSVI